MKTVPIEAVPADTVPQWVLALACRHPDWQLNICTCMLAAPPPTQPLPHLGQGTRLRVRIERLKSGELTFGVKGRPGEAMAAFTALRHEVPGSALSSRGPSCRPRRD